MTETVSEVPKKRFQFFFLGGRVWYINHCRLFNAKSFLIQINSSISNNSV